MIGLSERYVLAYIDDLELIVPYVPVEECEFVFPWLNHLPERWRPRLDRFPRLSLSFCLGKKV